MSDQPDKPQNINISTEGGSFVEGGVNTGGGDFVGRDKIVHNVHQVVQQAISAAEEARQAQDLVRQRLAEGVRTYAQRLAAIAADTTDTDKAGPYKGLLAYTLADAEVFFGRDKAMGNLLAQMERHRLTVLQSESGAGKSSLLHAGIAPRLLAAGHLPVILRPYNRPPDWVIKQTFLPDLAQAPTLRDAPLRAFLRPVTEMLEAQATLVLILDQFEEFFTLLPDEAERARFVEELADCMEDESLPVRWVLALRSEFFGDLAAFRPRIRNPFQNDFRLNRLTQEEARDVITRPAQHYGIGYEERLVTRLLEHLSEDGEVHPPQLQLVCLALYQTLIEQQPKGSDQPRTITEQMYMDAGEAAGILRGHLNRVLSRSLPTRQERDLARQLLVALVSADQRRIRRTRSDLAAALATGIVTAQTLDDVLDELVVSRLLNVEVDEASDDHSYEIAHDYLLAEVQIDPEVQAQKAAQELLNQEVDAYKRYGTLLDRSKHEIINSQLAFLRLDETAEELLAQSQTALAQAEAEKKEAERTRQRSRLFAGGLVLAAFVIAVVVYLAFAAQSARNVAELAATAEATARLQAIAEAEKAATSEAEALVAKATAEASQAEAVAAKAEVERLTRGIRADQLTSNALNVANGVPAVALLLAVEGLRSQYDFVQKYTVTEIAYDFGQVAYMTKTRVITDGQPVVNTARTNAFALIEKVDGHPGRISLEDDERSIHNVAFSPDGTWLAGGGLLSSSGTPSIFLWKMEDLTATPMAVEPSIIVTQSLPVADITFSPDGRWLVTSPSEAQDINIYNVNELSEGHDTQPRTVDMGHCSNQLAISPDGRWLVAPSVSFTSNGACLWDLNAVVHGSVSGPTSLHAPLNMAGYEMTGSSVAFSPDGRWLVTAGWAYPNGGSIRLWDSTTLDQNDDDQYITQHILDEADTDNRVFEVAFSSDGLWLAIGTGTTIHLLDASDLERNFAQEAIFRLNSESVPFALSFSRDGRWLAVGVAGGEVLLWDIAELTALGEAAPASTQANDFPQLAFSPNGEWLAVTSDSGISLWHYRMSDLINAMCTSAGRNMTDAEWELYIQGMGYRRTCNQWDADDSVLEILWNSMQSLALKRDKDGVRKILQEMELLDQHLGQQLLEEMEAAGITVTVGDELETATNVMIASYLFGDALIRAQNGDILDATATLMDVKTILLQAGIEPNLFIEAMGESDLQLDQPEVIAKRFYAEALIEEARTLAKQGSVEDAISRFEQAQALDPSQSIRPATEAKGIYAQALIEEGRSLAEQGRLDDAISKFEEAQALDPSQSIKDIHAQVLVEAARRLAEQGSLDDAISRFEEAQALDPSQSIQPAAAAKGIYAQVLVEEARSLAKQGSVEDAISKFEQAQALDPSQSIRPAAEAKGIYAQVLVEEARWDSPETAIAKIEEALAFDAEMDSDLLLTAHLVLGESLLTTGVYTAGMTALTTAQVISPTVNITGVLFSSSWNTVCWEGSLAGVAADVLPACERAVALNPESGDILDSRGLARALTGDLIGASEDFELAVQWAEETGADARFIESRTKWIEALMNGENPFDEALLEELRNK